MSMFVELVVVYQVKFLSSENLYRSITLIYFFYRKPIWTRERLSEFQIRLLYEMILLIPTPLEISYAISPRNNLNAIQANPPPLQFINAARITLMLPDSLPLTFFSVYVSQNYPIRDIISDIGKLINYDINTFLINNLNVLIPS